MNTGLIIGEDPRMCACCGGLKLTFSDSLNPANFILITNPEFLRPPANISYPVRISFDWDTVSSCGTTPRIKVVGFLTKWK